MQPRLAASVEPRPRRKPKPRRSRSWMTIAWEPITERYRVRFRAPSGGTKQVAADLKRIDPGRRDYDEPSRVWSIAAEALDEVIAVAKRHFDDATLIEGDRYRNLITGQTVQQLVLF